MILHLPAVLDPATLDQVRAALRRACWVDGRATAGHAFADVKHNRQVDEADAAGAEAGALIVAALERHPAFVSAALPARIVPPLFNRYGVGDRYGPHIDGAIRVAAGGERVRTDVSATLFLSDAADYAGGALCIAGAAGEDRVRLPAGDMILYPASTVHHVEPVTAGVRIAAFFWVQSLVRDEVKRATLHDLDAALQALASENVPPALMAPLYGHYHNLLRRWAEP